MTRLIGNRPVKLQHCCYFTTAASRGQTLHSKIWPEMMVWEYSGPFQTTESQWQHGELKMKTAVLEGSICTGKNIKKMVIEWKRQSRSKRLIYQGLKELQMRFLEICKWGLTSSSIHSLYIDGCGRKWRLLWTHMFQEFVIPPTNGWQLAWEPPTRTHMMPVWVTPRRTCQLHRCRQAIMWGRQQGTFRKMSGNFIKLWCQMGSAGISIVCRRERDYEWKSILSRQSRSKSEQRARGGGARETKRHLPIIKERTKGLLEKKKNHTLVSIEKKIIWMKTWMNMNKKLFEL